METDRHNTAETPSGRRTCVCSRKRVTRGSAAVTAAALLLSYWTTAKAADRIEFADFFVTKTVKVAATDDVTPSGPVGLVSLDDHAFLFCDYRCVWLLEYGGDSPQILPVAFPENLPRSNPTGLFYDAADGLVYIANYKGGDVLVCRFDAAGRSLRLVRRITCPSMKGPENVFVSAGEVFVADYDAGLVLAFTREGKPLWETPVAQAHAICASGDAVYASSLAKRQLLKMTRSGEVITSAGGLGSGPGRYIWPVSIIETHEGGLAILDPQAGRIMLVGPNLEQRRSFGANGPGIDLFNYPYAVARIDGGYAVGDTLKERVVIFDDTWRAVEELTWGETRRSETGLAPAVPDAKRPYNYLALPAVDPLAEAGVTIAGGRRATSGFNSIDLVSPLGGATEIEIDDPALPCLTGGSYWYMMWSVQMTTAPAGRLCLVGSPQKPGLIAIDPRTGACMDLDFRTNYWPLSAVSQDEASAGVSSEMATVASFFTKVRSLMESGLSPEESYANAKGLALDQLRHNYWQVVLSSTRAGKRFFAALTASDDLAAAAQRYYLWALGSPTVYLREVLAVRFLSGTPCRLVDVTASAQGLSEARFHRGHGLDAALDNDVTTYAAAGKEQNNYDWSLALSPARRLFGMTFDWYPGNAPELFTIELRDAAGGVTETVDVGSDDVGESVVFSKTPAPVAAVHILMRRLDGQKRLLLRDVHVACLCSGLDEVERLSKRVSCMIDYSAEKLTRTAGTTAEAVLANGHGHCGHFAYLLQQELAERGYRCRAWDIQKENGPVHTVLEVFNGASRGNFVADPTLGVVYPHGLFELLADPSLAVPEAGAQGDPQRLQRFDEYYGQCFFTGPHRLIRSYTADALEACIAGAMTDEEEHP